MFKFFGSKLIQVVSEIKFSPRLLYTVENSLRNIVEVLITAMEDIQNRHQSLGYLSLLKSTVLFELNSRMCLMQSLILLHTLFNCAFCTIKKRKKLLLQKQAKSKAVVTCSEMAEFTLGKKMFCKDLDFVQKAMIKTKRPTDSVQQK